MIAPEVSVIIPTYRESQNLVRLLPELFRVLEQHRIIAEVLVVDDDSRDGTVGLFHSLMGKNQLRLICRYGERGLATAVIKGLCEARGDILVVMDADLSHPPEAVPALVHEARSPVCDIAVGSRFCRGATVDPSWSHARRLNTKVASFLARGLTHVSDPTSGFFAIKREILNRCPALRPVGFKILLEVIVRCRCKNIVEIPITFQDRTMGKSKLSPRQQILYLRHLGRLYLAQIARARTQNAAEEVHAESRQRRAA